MKKFKQIFVILFAVMLFAAGLCGCQSVGYYQDQAVQAARSFLLEESPDIPLMEQEYIKFNRPFLMVSHLSGNQSTGTFQICVCWMTPDNPDVYMVYGTSGKNMIDWVPQKVIKKSFQLPQKHFLTLAQSASAEMIQKQFGVLTIKSVNHIRYTLPGVWKSKFPLDSNPENPIAPEVLAEAKKLPNYVLAWELEEAGKKFYSVYGGTAKDDKLTDFKYYFNGIYSESDFKANIADIKPLIAPFGGK